MVETLIGLALDEDVGSGDLTSQATIPADARNVATLVMREGCIVSGLALLEPLARAYAKRIDGPSVVVADSVGDATRVEPGTAACTLHGDARSLLTLERTILNFVGRMSGIATLTARYVEEVRRSSADTRVLDTRKTTPGHRVLEKYAVQCGGGSNHRMGLFDAVLIKDNHVAAAGGIAAAVRGAIEHSPDGVDIECECDTLEQVGEAIEAGARAILLDNFTPAQARDAVAFVDGRARLEVSGGVTLETIAAYAAAGVDDVSVGRLTHSAVSIDVSLELAPASE
jgi:nicotinate-nucleotide pyrophosphorylase (carboxylating)